jgi:hypothetical protein
MTESDWNSCADPQAMLDFLLAAGKGSDRKLRLFACASCRGVWKDLGDAASRAAIEVAERFADGEATPEELSESGSAAGDAPWAAIRAGDSHGESAHAASWVTAPGAGAAADITARFARGCVRDEANAGAWVATRPDEERRQAHLLRDVFGALPFCPVTIDQSLLGWNGRTVVKMAQAIYDGRLLPSGHLDPQRLSVLADALEEAGCSNADVLGHLRSPGPHVRGWFLVDLLLNRA